MKKSCRNCIFCKRDSIDDYIKEADLYKCDMDGDMILDPSKEGQDCTWYKENKRIPKRTKAKDIKRSIASKIRRYRFGENK